MARRTERGTAVVEFALVFPIVLAFVLGIIQYGYHYWALETASATAREAARALIVGSDPACVVAVARHRADQPAVGSAAPVVTIEYVNETGLPRRGDLVRVTVRFQSFDLGLLPVPDDGWVEQTATNRIENVPEDALSCDRP